VMSGGGFERPSMVRVVIAASVVLARGNSQLLGVVDGALRCAATPRTVYATRAINATR
jgi:hypothetical protein